MPSPITTTTLNRLRATPPRPADELRQAVASHLAEVQQAADVDPFVDAPRATQCAEALLALLDLHPSVPASDQAWIQAACLYFTECDDDESDLTSIIGFDDDAEVINDVVYRLGQHHLHILVS